MHDDSREGALQRFDTRGRERVIAEFYLGYQWVTSEPGFVGAGYKMLVPSPELQVPGTIPAAADLPLSPWWDSRLPAWEDRDGVYTYLEPLMVAVGRRFPGMYLQCRYTWELEEENLEPYTCIIPRGTDAASYGDDVIGLVQAHGETPLRAVLTAAYRAATGQWGYPYEDARSGGTNAKDPETKFPYA